MTDEHEFIIPDCPEVLQSVDIVKVCFSLDFLTPCKLQPADFLSLGKTLRVVGRQSLDPLDTVAAQQWRSLFQPALSDDPVAQRKFQKPAPGFVVAMPIAQQKVFGIGDQLDLEVLFIGTAVPLIHVFMRSLIHLGALGLVAGDGRFEVTEVCSLDAGDPHPQVWQQGDPLDSFACSVKPLTWLLQNEHVLSRLTIRYLTPTRLMVDGKPLRKPSFSKVFPFMLRRVTSMLYAHGGIEVVDDPAALLEKASELSVLSDRYDWRDWRTLTGRQGMMIGGFVGETTLSGQSLGDVYWVLAVASLFGVGKGATYGAGHFTLGFE